MKESIWMEKTKCDCVTNLIESDMWLQNNDFQAEHEADLDRNKNL